MKVFVVWEAGEAGEDEFSYATHLGLIKSAKIAQEEGFRWVYPLSDDLKGRERCGGVRFHLLLLIKFDHLLYLVCYSLLVLI